MNAENQLAYALYQFLSGAAAFFGFVFLVYYCIRLAIGEARDRKIEAAERVRILAILATAYGMATILGLIVEPRPFHATWLVFAVVAGVRCGVWRSRMRHEKARKVTTPH
jgi:hypothetical protein